MLDRGIEDVKAGRVLPHDEAIKEIERIREQRKISANKKAKYSQENTSVFSFFFVRYRSSNQAPILLLPSLQPYLLLFVPSHQCSLIFSLIF